MIPMTGNNRRPAFRFDALVLAVYFALAPVHQTLVLANGSTVIRYLAAAAMTACVLQGWRERKEYVVRWDLIWPVLFMAVWFALTILWARSRAAAVSKYTRNLSYFALMRVTCDKEKCSSCGKCKSVCPMDVDVTDNSRNRKNGTECILCMECVRNCPKKAL